LTLFILEEGGRLIKHLLLRGGASARDFILSHQYGIEPRRKTGDIDLGVEVANWDQFKTLFDSLIFNRPVFSYFRKQRLRCGIVLIDISPLVLSPTRRRNQLAPRT